MHPRLVLATAVTVLATLGPVVVEVGRTADAATVTAAYASGHRDVIINGYGTPGLGAFVLDTGAGSERAWCTEANVSHTRRAGAYGEVPTALVSPELDALVWSMARARTLDDDTATAAAALVWYYAGARRSIGPAVWSDGARGFAAISPTSPAPWDALPRLTLQHPVGLRAGAIDLDAAERRVAELHRWATAHRGPWALTAGAEPGVFVLRGPGGPIAGASVDITLRVPGRDPVVASVATDPDGTAAIAVPVLADGGSISARAEAPGPHRAWDGPGEVQRLVTATARVLTADVIVPASTTPSTTSSTTTSSTIPSTTSTSSTTTSTTTTSTTTSSTTSTTSTSTTSTSTSTSSSTTTPSTTTSSTTTSSTTPSTAITPGTIAPTTTSSTTPPRSGPSVAVPPTLPRTGGAAGAAVLRAADVAFVVGVGLTAIAALAPRRPDRRPDARTAGRRSAPPFGR